MNYNLGFPFGIGLPQLRPLVNEQQNKLVQFTNLLRSNQIEQALQLFSFESDNHYDFILAAAQKNKLEIIDHFIDLGISPNIESKKGVNLIYALSKKEEYFPALEHLIKQHNAKINLEKTFFHPLMGTLKEPKINIKSFIFLIRHGANLDIINVEGDTCLLLLIKHKATKMIKWFLEQYKNKYGESMLKEYVNKANFLLIYPLYAALNFNNSEIARHLVFLGAKALNGNKIVSMNNSFKIIKLYDPPPTEKFIIFKKQPLCFEEFYYILTHRLCTDWCNISLSECRKIFDLPYSLEIIFKSTDKCCMENMKHDYDGVLFYCRYYKEDEVTKNIQNIYRKTQKNKSADYKIKKNAAIKIQKTWRRKKNIEKLKENCVICMSSLNLYITNDNTILPCKHIFHKYCLQRWRKENNFCPICKSSINKPLVTI